MAVRDRTLRAKHYYTPSRKDEAVKNCNQFSKAKREKLLEGYDYTSLIARFPGPRCFNCANAYDLAECVLGRCECMAHKRTRARRYPFGCDAACDRWIKKEV